MIVVEHKLKNRDSSQSKNRLVVAILLNIIIVTLQILYGFLSNSISLLTDAIHNLQDVVSLIVALIAVLVVQKLPTKEMTFGFVRSEALAGFVNSIFLMVAVFIVIFFAINRLFNPQEIEGIYVVVFGLFGFLINFVSAKILVHHHNQDEHHDNDHQDLNIKAAYLHLLSDAGISLGVFVGGLLIYLYQLYWVDPIFAIIFSLYILKENFSVMKKSYRILMEAVPEHLSIEEILKDLQVEFKQIREVHDIHVWSLSSKDIYVSAHIVIDEVTMREYDKLLKQLELFFKQRGIEHITIQPETSCFKCEIYH